MNVGKQKIALGCYTDASHPNGLKMLELDESSGVMSVLAERPVSNALYQALSSDGKYLYSCTGEGLASFRADGLEPVDSLPLGNCVCHVSAMPDGKRVVFADYLGGFAGSVEVADGRFGHVVKHQHSGSGPNLPRQSCAHCHQAIPTPDGKGYCVVDLGLDQIVEYPSGRVFRTLPSGAGPRHLLFHPNGRLAFLVYELGNLVSSLSWSPVNGFKIIDTYSTLIDCSRKERKDHKEGLSTNDNCHNCSQITNTNPGKVGETSPSSRKEEKFHSPTPTLNSNSSACSTRLNNLVNPVNPVKNNQAAAIRLVPDGRRVVVSNRGENSLAVFDFDESTGKLSFKSRTMLKGDWPRDFIFVSDSLALVACERSGEVLGLNYEKDTGVFKTVATLGGLFRPVSLLKGIAS